MANRPANQHARVRCYDRSWENLYNDL
ncbi:MAG: hypothetical protein LBL24_02625 [Bacteroidales bacterium]|nr:hypothetical protein [Bacteroidales bacterium]